jgi:hypothetical protein
MLKERLYWEKRKRRYSIRLNDLKGRLKREIISYGKCGDQNLFWVNNSKNLIICEV